MPCYAVAKGGAAIWRFRRRGGTGALQCGAAICAAGHQGQERSHVGSLSCQAGAAPASSRISRHSCPGGAAAQPPHPADAARGLLRAWQPTPGSGRWERGTGGCMLLAIDIQCQMHAASTSCALTTEVLKLPPMPRCYLPTAAVIKSLPACPDFHPSCLSTASIIACKAKDPVVAKQAAALAVQVLIKPDSSSCAQPAGADALLLRMARYLCGELGGGCAKGCPALPRKRPLTTTASACPMCRPGGPAAFGVCVCSARVRRRPAAWRSWSFQGAGCCHPAGYQAHLSARC